MSLPWLWLGLAPACGGDGLRGTVVDGMVCESQPGVQCICQGDPGRFLANCDGPNPFGRVFYDITCVEPSSTINLDGQMVAGCQVFFQSNDPNFEVTIAETGGAAILQVGETRRVVLDTHAAGTGFTTVHVIEEPPGVEVDAFTVEVSDDCGCGA